MYTPFIQRVPVSLSLVCDHSYAAWLAWSSTAPINIWSDYWCSWNTCSPSPILTKTKKKWFWDQPWHYLPDTRLSQIGRFGFDQGYCLGKRLASLFFVSALISLIAVQTVPTMHAMWGSGTGLWTGIMASNGLRWEWYFWPACIEFEICGVTYKF